ncbi:hypothetical protein BC829DRAFT_413909 [Chytridium lagenaria]|nr:hypothetical protein BC829DRAFT_413909 [Chytridium lagenaria]
MLTSGHELDNTHNEESVKTPGGDTYSLASEGRENDRASYQSSPTAKYSMRPISLSVNDVESTPKASLFRSHLPKTRVKALLSEADDVSLQIHMGAFVSPAQAKALEAMSRVMPTSPNSTQKRTRHFSKSGLPGFHVENSPEARKISDIIWKRRYRRVKEKEADMYTFMELERKSAQQVIEGLMMREEELSVFVKQLESKLAQYESDIAVLQEESRTLEAEMITRTQEIWTSLGTCTYLNGENTFPRGPTSDMGCQTDVSSALTDSERQNDTPTTNVSGQTDVLALLDAACQTDIITDRGQMEEALDRQIQELERNLERSEYQVRELEKNLDISKNDIQNAIQALEILQNDLMESNKALQGLMEILQEEDLSENQENLEHRLEKASLESISLRRRAEEADESRASLDALCLDLKEKVQRLEESQDLLRQENEGLRSQLTACPSGDKEGVEVQGAAPCDTCMELGAELRKIKILNDILGKDNEGLLYQLNNTSVSR